MPTQWDALWVCKLVLTLRLRKLCKNDFQRCRQQIGDEGDSLEGDESQVGKGNQQPSTAQYSQAQPSTVQYSPVQPGTAQYSPVQPRKAQYIPVEPRTAQNNPVQPKTAQ